MPSLALLKVLFRFRKLISLYVVAETAYKTFRRVQRSNNRRVSRVKQTKG